MPRHTSTTALDFNNKDVVTQGERGVHIAADLKDAYPAATDRARYPSINSRASCRAGSSAGTAGRCDAAGAPSARTGVAAETSAPAAASVSLAQIAWGRSRDHVFTGGLAAFAARDDVIEGEIVIRRAVLANE